MFYGKNTKKHSHQNGGAEGNTEDDLSTRRLIIHKSITDRYQVLKTSIWERTNVSISQDVDQDNTQFHKNLIKNKISQKTMKNITMNMQFSLQPKAQYASEIK